MTPQHVERNETRLDVLHGIEKGVFPRLFGGDSLRWIHLQTFPNQIEQQLHDGIGRSAPTKCIEHFK